MVKAVAKSSFRRRAVRVLKLLAIIYLLTLTGVLLGQRHLLYFPSRAPVESVIQLAGQSRFTPWEDYTGRVIGWKYIGQTNDVRDRILITHGNAGSGLDRISWAETLNLNERFDVYILEYPGYGARPGTPTQRSLCEAADQAFDLISKERPVYLLGESLGTGVASYLAGTHAKDVGGVILVAPFHNLGDVAQYHMPIFPAKWMLWDQFPSAEQLRNYRGRLAVLLDGQDTVIPDRFGRKLFESYGGPKRLWEVPKGAHTALPDQADAWWKEVLAFWKGPT
jgi:pimeloyl-ACP methyl ester carboxylesterase